MKSRLTRVMARIRSVPLLDHVIRAYQRYSSDQGDRLAAAVTFYWFLSLFPILLVAISILGYALGDDARTQVISATKDYLPGPLSSTVGDIVANNKGTAGIIGLIGTLLSGLGWVDALRQAIRALWHHAPSKENFVVKKLVDILLLLGLFAVIGGSTVATGYISSGTGALLHALGVSDSVPAKVFTQLLGTVASLVVDGALFLFLFTVFTGIGTKLRDVLDGVVFGAIGFEVLKRVGSYYVTRTTTKGEATYGTFAVVVGLLLFLNLLMRVMLLAASFAVTAHADSDTHPSGTAPADAAPHSPAPDDRDWVGATGDLPPMLVPAGTGVLAAPAGSRNVKLAAQVTGGVLGATVLGVGLHALRTARGLLRR